MLTVGLTGGFATGKTTVAELFRQAGAEVLIADEMVRRLLSVRGKCFKRIVKAFGPGILKRGSICRPKLAEIVFHDERKRKQLEKIIHPLVISQIQKRIHQLQKQQRAKVVVAEVPLLFEAGLGKNFDVTLAVIATRSEQIDRARKAKGLTRRETINRIEAQMPVGEKVRRSDFIIDNRGSLADTKKQVSRAWQCFTRLQQARKNSKRSKLRG